MGALKITNFLGVMPQTAERLLPESAAQEAENVNLTSGEIRTVRPPLTVYTPVDISNTHYAAYRAFNGTTEKWRTWTVDIDVARGPLSPDVEARYYWTGDSCPRYSTFTNFGTTDWALGIPTPTTKPSVSVTGGASTSTVTRSYCYTFVNDLGEESAPSPVADPVSGKPDGTWTITGFSGTPTNDRAVPYNTGTLKQRLYRTAGTAAGFQLVAERAVSTGSWADTVTDADMLGDDLISIGWEPPPVGMKGLIVLPNGSMVGFYGNQILYSEPYQPHAYPKSYRYQTESPIVGIAAYGTTVVIATQTRPYVADGVTPDVVTTQSVDNVWPCLSKRSVCSVGDAVIYATSQGLATIGSSGPTILTQQQRLYTQEEWLPLNPSSMICAMSNGRIFVVYTVPGSLAQTLVITPGMSLAQRYSITPGQAVQPTAILTRYSLSPSELYVDPMDGGLYLVDKYVHKWDAGYGDRMMFNWLSKQIEIPDPLNLGAAKVDFESTMSPADYTAAKSQYAANVATNAALIADQQLGAYAQDAYNVYAINESALIHAALNFDKMSFTLYANGVEVYHTDLDNTDAFRLPAGYKGDVLSFRLVGNMKVRSVKMAETMIGLKQV